MFRLHVMRRPLVTLCGLPAVLMLLAKPVAGQGADASADPNAGNLTLTGSFDVVSTYMFRGFRQHSTGIASWPAADLGIAYYSGDGRFHLLKEIPCSTSVSFC